MAGQQRRDFGFLRAGRTRATCAKKPLKSNFQKGNTPVADTALMLVPGLNCTAALFGPQLAALGDGLAITIPDHRSHGSIEAMAAHALANAPPCFALCGLSMGGYIALEILRQAPERVTRLGLLDTRCQSAVPAEAPSRLRLVEWAKKGLFDEVHGFLWPKLVHPSRDDDAELEQIVIGMMHATGAAAFERQQNALMLRRDYRDLLPHITVPALVLVGEQDAITPVRYSQEMASLIPGSRLVVVPECGHLSSLEAPDAVNRALREWLAV
jgi:pimeloyl-ACP methyl ester carboxylesterase